MPICAKTINTLYNLNLSTFEVEKFLDGVREKDREIHRLQKVIELSDDRSLEYICIIDVISHTYSVFRDDNANSHDIPQEADFDTVTKYIRDRLIPESDRTTYYEKARLDHVIKHMNDGGYSYRYVMNDGIVREASFSWYEDDRVELIMTVRKLV